MNKLFISILLLLFNAVSYAQLEVNFIMDNQKGCKPLTVNFANTSKNYSELKWDFGNGEYSDEENPTVIYQDAGIFICKLTVTDQNGIEKEETDTIQVYDTPVANFEVKPDTVYENQPIRCYNLSEGEELEYTWEFTNQEAGVLYYYDKNPICRLKTGGFWNIQLIVENKYGCRDSMMIENAVYMAGDPRIVFPNAFSPNPNGPNGGHYTWGVYTNDVFYPVHRGVREYNLQIFTKSGRQVFMSNDPDIGWDGWYNGKLCKRDVYYYQAKAVFEDGTSVEKLGYVVLVRHYYK